MVEIERACRGGGRRGPVPTGQGVFSIIVYYFATLVRHPKVVSIAVPGTPLPNEGIYSQG